MNTVASIHPFKNHRNINDKIEGDEKPPGFNTMATGMWNRLAIIE